MKKYLIIGIIGVLIAGVVVGIFLLREEKKINAGDNNLLIITLDTTRADRIGAYGCEQAKTPSIDFLAKNGVLFKNCYSPVPLTLPSHATMFTGKYPIAHSVRDNGIYVLGEREITLAEKMKEMDFHTFSVIASFVLLAKFGLNQGFDFYDDSLNSHKMYNNYSSEIPAPVVYNKFLQWFEKNHSKRFFGWVHFYDPHDPYRAPKKYSKKFKNDKKGRYDAEIACIDDFIGKIIDKLKEKKILEKTIVIIAGDHGEAFGEHEEFGHGIFCYDESLKVPLVFYNTKLFPGGLEVTSPVNLIDLMPTILDLYGKEIPKGVQGKSLVYLLQREDEPGTRDFYFESMHGKHEMNWAPLMGIINGSYKYISLPDPELYDLQKDKKEKANLFLKKNRIAKELDKKLKKMAAEHAESAVDTRRDLTEKDKKQLESLGYISSFSSKTNKNMDPKKGMVLDNKIKEVFRNIAEKKIDLAEEHLEELLQSEKTVPAFYDLQIQLYRSKNEFGKVFEVVKEALEKYPEIDRFYIIYAFRVFDEGKYEAAERSCRQLIKVNPKFTRAYILLGQIAEKRKNTGSAIENYKLALDIEPQNISLKIKYAELLIMKKDFERALQVYNELLERDEISTNNELLFKIAMFNSQYGTLTKSEQLLKKVTALNPKGKYYFNYALVLFKNKNLPGALKNMEIALGQYGSELNERQTGIARKAIKAWKPAVER